MFRQWRIVITWRDLQCQTPVFVKRAILNPAVCLTPFPSSQLTKLPTAVHTRRCNVRDTQLDSLPCLLLSCRPSERRRTIAIRDVTPKPKKLPQPRSEAPSIILRDWSAYSRGCTPPEATIPPGELSSLIFGSTNANCPCLRDDMQSAGRAEGRSRRREILV